MTRRSELKVRMRRILVLTRLQRHTNKSRSAFTAQSRNQCADSRLQPDRDVLFQIDVDKSASHHLSQRETGLSTAFTSVEVSCCVIAFSPNVFSVVTRDDSQIPASSLLSPTQPLCGRGTVSQRRAGSPPLLHGLHSPKGAVRSSQRVVPSVTFHKFVFAQGSSAKAFQAALE